MENVSQVILRNRESLQDSDVLLVDPAPDSLFRELGECCSSVRLSTASFGVHRRLGAMGADIGFAPCPRAANSLTAA